MSHNEDAQKVAQLKKCSDKKDFEKHIYDSLILEIRKYIYCEPYQETAIALWIIKTWCMPAFKVAPILVITAMTKSAGKSQLLNLIGYLCKTPVLTSNITAAALFRYIEEYKPTILIDEADTFLNKNEDLRGIVNAGFEKNGCIIRCTGQDDVPTKYNVFCPKAIAGIGRLSDTIQSRAIVINMHPKPTNVEKANLRKADESEFDELKHWLELWADQNLTALAKHEPKMPDRLSDRQKDCWEALLTIADLLGKEVAEQARNAAIEICQTNVDEPHINELMLLDVRKVFDERKVERLPTSELINTLSEDDEAAWKYLNRGGKITPRQLAQILKQFGISSKQIRFGQQTKKGYDIADFQKSFSKYLHQ